MVSNIYRIWRNPSVGWFLRLAFSALILTLLSTQVDFVTVLDTLRSANVQFLVPAFVLFFVVRLIWAYQMSLGLAPLGMRLTTPRLFKVILIAGFYSLVLPGNLVAGGTASWYKLSRSNGRGIEAAALLVYFRIVNTLTLLGVGLLGMWLDPRLATPSFRAVVGVMFVGVVLAFLPFVSTAATDQVERVGRAVLRKLPLHGCLREKGPIIWKALKSFQELDSWTVVIVLGLSLLSHLLSTFVFYLLTLAIDIHLSVFVVGWVRSMLQLFEFLPISIAGLGVREVSLVLLLADYGIPETQALGCSLVIFASVVVGVIIGGLFEMWDVLRGGRRSRRSVAEEDQDAAVRGWFSTK